MYSQEDEEKYIVGAFEEHHKGRFLDIGAYHPTDKSNTRALYERGWSGVMIEPSPMPLDTLLRAYGNNERVTLICAAVGLENLLGRIYASADAVSTTVASHHETWSKLGGYYGSFLIPQITLEQISNQFGGFDFINIDAEGISVDLFSHAIKLGWRPHCWCVEIDTGRGDELDGVATLNGYKIVRSTGGNKVMVL